MLKAEHLLAFCLAAKYQSISAAAKELGLSQPAISGQLASLQKHAGQTLYQRSSHGIELTEAGQSLLPYACAVAQTLMQAQSHLRGDRQIGRVQLQFGISHHLVPLYTGSILKASRDYQKQGAKLDVHLREAYSHRLLHLVQNRELDAAYIITGPNNQHSPLELKPLQSQTIVLLVKPDDPVARETEADVRILEGESVILSSSQSQIYKRVRTSLEEMGVQPGRILEVSGPEAVKNAVLDDLGIGITLGPYVQREVKAGWFKTVRLSNQGFSVRIARVTQDLSTFDPKKRQLLEMLLELQERQYRQEC